MGRGKTLLRVTLNKPTRHVRRRSQARPRLQGGRPPDVHRQADRRRQGAGEDVNLLYKMYTDLTITNVNEN